MSDDEEEYQYDDDEYNYGSDADENDEAGNDDNLIQIENAFYEGEECLADGKAQNAKEKFELVVELSDIDNIKWKFKALQNLVVLCYTLNEYTDLLAKYREMLSHISSVTRNECTDAINNILDVVQGASNVTVLSEIYEITLVALKSTNNERLWFSTNLKLAKIYMESKKIPEVENILSVLKKSCQNADGIDDMSKGNNLLEVYCLEIQLCSLTLDSLRMRDIYPKTLNISSAVVDLRTMGVIREEGGKLYMAEGNWNEAYNELYQAFRHYQEAGNARAKDCLKYVIMASMLMLNDINPFAAREVKVYENDKEILAMSELRKCLEANDLTKFEKTIRNKQNKIIDEPFLMTYIQPLRRRMREQAILNLVKPFRKVSFDYLAKELILTIEEVENILVSLILDEKLLALIDQVNGHIFFTEKSVSGDFQKLLLLEKVTSNLKDTFHNLNIDKY